MKVIHDALKSDTDLCIYVPKSEVATATTYSANVLNSLSNGGLGHAILLTEIIKQERQTARIDKDKLRHLKDV